MKLAIVAQRYGTRINGGAELHARYIAEHLARHAEVEVLTTCALDYVSWRNELPKGVEQVNGVQVRRFPVRHERDPLTFGRRSQRVFGERHSIADELNWLDAEGPASPSLIRFIGSNASAYDYLIFFSYRYYHAFHGARAAAANAVLVPTAERDDAIGLSIFKPLFGGVRALMYNSPEERAMIQALAGNQSLPSVVVGIGSDVPPHPQPARFRQKFAIGEPFAIYVGRIDENKGCKQLFNFFESYLRNDAGRLSLVLIGNSLLDIPSHPRIRHLGFLDDTDKFDAMAAAELLVMPSYFESLSMVALEAWALGRPVVANARCDVLKGQCIRSNAGLYYETEAEFVGTLQAVEQHRWVSGALGRNGRQFFRDHYDWPIIEGKYLDMFDRLGKESAVQTMRPLPGWFERRRNDCPPASEVTAALPSGPWLGFERQTPLRRTAAAAPTAAASPPPMTSNRPPPGSRPQAARHHDRRRHPRRGGTARSRNS